MNKLWFQSYAKIMTIWHQRSLPMTRKRICTKGKRAKWFQWKNWARELFKNWNIRMTRRINNNEKFSVTRRTTIWMEQCTINIPPTPGTTSEAIIVNHILYVLCCKISSEQCDNGDFHLPLFIQQLKKLMDCEHSNY